MNVLKSVSKSIGITLSKGRPFNSRFLMMVWPIIFFDFNVPLTSVYPPSTLPSLLPFNSRFLFMVWPISFFDLYVPLTISPSSIHSTLLTGVSMCLLHKTSNPLKMRLPFVPQWELSQLSLYLFCS